ncbi:hypothetical protein EB001_09375 [bacterium]|nr:hypothetical protein [bacterium]
MNNWEGLTKIAIILSILITLLYIHGITLYIKLYSKYSKLCNSYDRVLAGYIEQLNANRKLNESSQNEPSKNSIKGFPRPLKWPYKPFKDHSRD